MSRAGLEFAHFTGRRAGGQPARKEPLAPDLSVGGASMPCLRCAALHALQAATFTRDTERLQTNLEKVRSEIRWVGWWVGGRVSGWRKQWWAAVVVAAAAALPLRFPFSTSSGSISVWAPPRFPVCSPLAAHQEKRRRRPPRPPGPIGIGAWLHNVRAPSHGRPRPIVWGCRSTQTEVTHQVHTMVPYQLSTTTYVVPVPISTQ